jgi:hypothetical protein
LATYKQIAKFEALIVCDVLGSKFYFDGMFGSTFNFGDLLGSASDANKYYGDVFGSVLYFGDMLGSASDDVNIQLFCDLVMFTICNYC